MFRLDGKVTLITGGGSGIGRSIAEIFSQQGAIVYILDIDQTDAQTTIEAIQQAGDQASLGYLV